MRWTVSILLVGVLISCCSVTKKSEWRWEEVHARTKMWYIPVTFPDWMEDEDREATLDAIDGYWTLMLEIIPESRQVDITTYVVHIHDNLGCFWVPEAETWCFGWQIGHHIQVAWSWDMVNGMPNGIGSKDPLKALCHEWLHIIVDMTWGWEDTGHMFFPMYKTQLDQIAEAAPTVHLSDLSRIKCKLFRYIPEGFDGPEH